MNQTLSTHDIKAIIFDFDGTLLDSNEIKRSSFYEILGHEKKSHQIMDDVLESNVGDRYAIWQKYVTQLQNVGDAREQIRLLSSRYTELVNLKLAQARPIDGSINLLNWIQNNKYYCFLSSATPLIHLLGTLDDMKWTRYFTDAYGSPNTKVQTLKLIAQKYNLNSKNMLVVGDGVDDELSASEFGCKFLRVKGNSAALPRTKAYDLFEVLEYIRKGESNCS